MSMIPNDSSRAGGWAFATDYFKNRQVVSSLEAERVNAYQQAACVEVIIQKAEAGSLPYLHGLKEFWYDEATRIEAAIEKAIKQGQNTDEEDDSSD